MKKTKHILSIVFAIVMVMSMSVVAFAADGAVAKIGDVEYATLKEALSAAVTGDTVTLLGKVSQNVTISKNITLDGNGKQYSGKISINGGLTTTIKNVRFVNGCIDVASNTKNKLTVSGCTFKGNYAKDTYAIKINGGSNLTVENTDAKAIYGFAYVNKAVANVSVKNVALDSLTYGVHVAYGNKINLEKVEMNNVDCGILVQTYGAKTFTVKNCTINAINPVYIYNRNSTMQTFNFVGKNVMQNLAGSDYATYKLTAGATLKAPAGLDVVTDVEKHSVDYNNGVYSVVEAIAAKIGETGYASLKAAVDAAEDGDVITVVADHELDFTAAEEIAEYGMKSLINVDKEVTIDLNGKTVTGNLDTEDMFVSVVFVEAKNGANGKLTLKDSSEDKSGKIEIASADTYVYSMFMTNGDDAVLNMESGSYIMDKVSNQGMFYATASKTINISGGYYELGNIGVDGATPPWFINVYGNADGSANVTGGTFSAYPVHHRGETGIADGYEVVENEDGTWSVVKSAVAAIGDAEYATIKEAVEAAKDGDVITVINDCEILSEEFTMSQTYIQFDSYVEVMDKAVTIDFNGKAVTANPTLDKVMSSVFYVGNTGSLTLKDSSEEKTGGLSVTMGEGTQAYSLIFADGDKSHLSIEGGNYYIDRVEAGYSMVYVAQSNTGVVSGGNFVLGNAKTILREGVMAPWIFNTYGRGVNFVSVKGGAYNTDPEHHQGEAKFPKGYVTVQGEDGMWRIVRGPVVITEPEDIEIGYNKMAHFTPEIKGVGLTYTWYYSDNGGKYFYKSTLTTPTYDVKGTVARDGRQIYCVATDAYGKTKQTKTVTLTVVPNEKLEIVSQPTVVEGTLNEKISVALDVNGDDLTYEWYYSDNGGKSFYKSSLTTPTYDIKLTQERMGRVVYCKITDAFGERKKSENIIINAVCTTPLKIVEQPSYEAVAVGEKVSVKMVVEGEGLTYTWYYRDAGATKWQKSTITAAEYSIILKESRVGREVYCVVTDAFGDSKPTDVVTIK